MLLAGCSASLEALCERSTEECEGSEDLLHQCVADAQVMVDRAKDTECEALLDAYTDCYADQGAHLQYPDRRGCLRCELTAYLDCDEAL